VGIDAALADQSQVRESLKKRLPDLRSLADQHEGLRVAEAIGEGIHVLDMVAEHGHLVSGELLKALQRRKRVEIVVENRNLHQDC
jgi:hypothetical protein